MSGESSMTPSQYIEVAQRHLVAGRAGEAVATLVEATARFPVNAEAHELLGRAYGQLGHNDLAVRSLTAAVSLRPDMHRARLQLAIAYRNLNRHAEAARELDDLLRQDPSNQEALRLRDVSGPAQVQVPNYVPQAQHAAYQQRAAFAPLPGYAQPLASPAPGLGQPESAQGQHAAQQPGAGAQPPLIPGAPQSTQQMPAGGMGPGSAPLLPPPDYSAARPPDDWHFGARARSPRHASMAAAPVSGYDPSDLGAETFMRVLTGPSAFFRDNRGWDDLIPPVRFALVVSAISYALTLVFAVIDPASQGMAAETAGAIVAQGLLGMVIGLPVVMLYALAAAGLLHLFVRLLGGDGPYSGSARAMLYTNVPSSLVVVVAGIIQLVVPTGLLLVATIGAGVSATWSFILVVIALREIHAMSGARAFFAAFVPFAVVALVFAALLVPVFMATPDMPRCLESFLRFPGGL